jgi:hypothetical protein
MRPRLPRREEGRDGEVLASPQGIDTLGGQFRRIEQMRTYHAE